MNNLFKTVVNWVAVGVGYMGGIWLWNNVLEEKADDLKNRLKKSEEGA